MRPFKRRAHAVRSCLATNYDFSTAAMEAASLMGGTSAVKTQNQWRLQRPIQLKLSEPMSHLLSLFGARLILTGWMQRRETSGREHFDTPGDLSQIIRA
jgi:hypothetical protein